MLTICAKLSAVAVVNPIHCVRLQECYQDEIDSKQGEYFFFIKIDLEGMKGA